MSMTDPLGDMLTRIRNGQQAGLTTVTSPASKLRERVLDVLQQEGFIRGYSVTELRSGISEITIELKYQEGTPVIREIQRVSRPGRRVYSKIRDLRQVYGGLGIAILSTPKGVLSDNSARAENVGGEVLCHVF
ncbi:MAG: 30S ribosomal protein S8 [Alphaproteobacteria bacterium]|jgi:small subunit ribosomal protein S8